MIDFYICSFIILFDFSFYSCDVLVECPLTAGDDNGCILILVLYYIYNILLTTFVS